MKLWKNTNFKRVLTAGFAALLLCLPLAGCGGGNQATQEKSPEEIEKSRQEHLKMSEREQAEG